MADDNKNNQVRLALDIWKTTIEVQQHFNTIEMQIRNFAVTVLTAALGAAALAYNQAQEAAAKAIAAGASSASYNSIVLFGLMFSPADMIVVAGLVAWAAFYFMDRWWYHRLLQGAVKHAQFIESQLKAELPAIALSNSIREASPFKVFGIWEIRSDRKIDIFYGTVVVILVIMIAAVF